MKFPTLVCSLPLDVALERFKGRTYVRTSELGLSRNELNVLGTSLHHAGYKKFRLKMNGQVLWVWVLDKSITTPVTDDARAELSAQGGRV